MNIFTYHIVKLSFLESLKLILNPLKSSQKLGLIHAETMTIMKLGSPLLSTSRFFSRKICLFAQWENEETLNQFITNNKIGKLLNTGWHVRLRFIRQWGHFSNFKIPTEESIEVPNEDPVIAVTLAKMKYFEIPRFLKWGRPVEKLVRDHSGTILSLASIKYPNLISTFSIWKSQKEMSDMVFGHSKMPKPQRHLNAMKERDRKDFHFEFTTLRFIIISEHGELPNHIQ